MNWMPKSLFSKVPSWHSLWPYALSRATSYFPAGTDLQRMFLVLGVASLLPQVKLQRAPTNSSWQGQPTLGTVAILTWWFPRTVRCWASAVTPVFWHCFEVLCLPLPALAVTLWTSVVTLWHPCPAVWSCYFVVICCYSVLLLCNIETQDCIIYDTNTHVLFKLVESWIWEPCLSLKQVYISVVQNQPGWG